MPEERHEAIPFYYRAYGLTLLSTIPLPELPVGDHPADVVVQLGRVTERPQMLDRDGIGAWARAEQACHYREDAGAFLVSRGREITADPNPMAAPEVVRLAILGPAMGLILHQRGTFAIHGSAVSIQGTAVVFLGGSAAGKSTMAALLHARGHDLLSDDVTALDIDGTEVHVIPSFPQIKLWPDAAEVVIGTSEKMPLVHPGYEKLAHRPTTGFKQEPVRLGRLYFLQVGDEIEVAPINAITGLELVLASWYGARFGDALIASLDQRAHFLRCTRLVKSVPMRFLRRPPLLNQDGFFAALEAAILSDLDGSS